MLRASVVLVVLAGIISACGMTEEYKTITYSEPLNGSESAQMTLVVPFQNTTIRAMPETEESTDEADQRLFRATLQYIGQLDYRAGESNNKIIYIEEKERLTQYGGDTPLSWLVWLSPEVPFALDLSFNRGTVEADLAGITLSTMKLQLNRVTATITLPTQSDMMTSDMMVANSELTLVAPDGTAFNLDNLTLNKGTALLQIGSGISFDADLRLTTGDMTLEFTSDTGVQINVEEYMGGNINLPSNYEVVMQSDPDTKEGVWQSPGFDDAEHQVILNLTIEDGDLVIR